MDTIVEKTEKLKDLPKSKKLSFEVKEWKSLYESCESFKPPQIALFSHEREISKIQKRVFGIKEELE